MQAGAGAGGQAVIPALLGKPTKPLTNKTKKVSRWVIIVYTEYVVRGRSDHL